MTAQSAQEIAASLTKAQQKAVLWLPADGAVTKGRIPRAYSAACGSLNHYHKNVAELHWVKRPRAHYSDIAYRLTPLGVEVRAILEKDATP